MTESSTIADAGRVRLNASAQIKIIRNERARLIRSVRAKARAQAEANKRAFILWRPFLVKSPRTLINDDIWGLKLLLASARTHRVTAERRLIALKDLATNTCGLEVTLTASDMFLLMRGQTL